MLPFRENSVFQQHRTIFLKELAHIARRLPADCPCIVRVLQQHRSIFLKELARIARRLPADCPCIVRVLPACCSQIAIHQFGQNIRVVFHDAPRSLFKLAVALGHVWHHLSSRYTLARLALRGVNLLDGFPSLRFEFARPCSPLYIFAFWHCEALLPPLHFGALGLSMNVNTRRDALAFLKLTAREKYRALRDVKPDVGEGMQLACRRRLLVSNKKSRANSEGGAWAVEDSE